MRKRLVSVSSSAAILKSYFWVWSPRLPHTTEYQPCYCFMIDVLVDWGGVFSLRTQRTFHFTLTSSPLSSLPQWRLLSAAHHEGGGQQLEKLYFRIARDRSDQVRKLFMVFVSKTLIPSKPYWETDNSTRDDYTPPKHQQRVNTGGKGG